MQKILLPFDGSHSAHSALAYILTRDELLKNAALHLVNVQRPAIAGQLAHVITLDIMVEMRLEAGQSVLQVARDVLNMHGILCNARVVLGKPAESIARYAEEQGCTMIVLGTRGLGAIRNLLLGSVASKVITLSRVPVTLVKATSSCAAKVQPALTAARERCAIRSAADSLALSKLLFRVEH